MFEVIGQIIVLMVLLLLMFSDMDISVTTTTIKDTKKTKICKKKKEK